MPLTKETLEQIEKQALEIYSLMDTKARDVDSYDYGLPMFDKKTTMQPVIDALTACADREAALTELLRFAGCPDILIENPTLIKGKKATDEDMAWAKPIIQKHLSYEAGVKQREQIAIQAFEQIQSMTLERGESDYKYAFNRCYNIATETIKKLKG